MKIGKAHKFWGMIVLASAIVLAAGAAIGASAFHNFRTIELAGSTRFILTDEVEVDHLYPNGDEASFWVCGTSRGETGVSKDFEFTTHVIDRVAGTSSTFQFTEPEQHHCERFEIEDDLFGEGHEINIVARHIRE